MNGAARWEYKVEQFPNEDKECEIRLNKLGARGWEFCGNQGIHMIMKRLKVLPPWPPEETTK